MSYEYVACQQTRHGCLILSEFTGAAHSLNGSLIVNPWATDQVADAINRAVTMSEADRAANFEKLSSYVSSFTAAQYVGTVLCARPASQIAEAFSNNSVGVSLSLPSYRASATRRDRTPAACGGGLCSTALAARLHRQRPFSAWHFRGARPFDRLLQRKRKRLEAGLRPAEDLLSEWEGRRLATPHSLVVIVLALENIDVERELSTHGEGVEDVRYHFA